MNEIAKLEKQIIASAIAVRDTYVQLVHLQVRSDLSPEGQRVLDQIGEFYQQDGSTGAANLEIVQSAILRKLTNPKHQELFQLYFGSFPPTISGVNVLSEVAALKRHRTGQKLASALIVGSEGSLVDSLIEEYNNFKVPEALLKPLPDHRTAWDIEDLMTGAMNRKNLIRIRPKTLNDRLEGGMMRGDHLVITALTEVGKTLFATNIAAGCAMQGFKVVYGVNEEPKARTNLRVINNLTGFTKSELYDPTMWEQARKILGEKGYGNFTIVDLTPGTLEELEGLVDEFEADVLVVDQLRNLNVGNDNRTQQLEQAATGVRNIGKRSNTLVISVTQAADSARGKSILNSGDIDGSNVGIPGQADVILACGATEEHLTQGIRCISFPKQKLGSNEPFFVTINPLLSRVEEL